LGFVGVEFLSIDPDLALPGFDHRIVGDCRIEEHLKGGQDKAGFGRQGIIGRDLLRLCANRDGKRKQNEGVCDLLHHPAPSDC